MPNLNDLNEISAQMAEEYGLRYGLRSDQMFAAAQPPGRGVQDADHARQGDPDWPAILALLEQSYRRSQRALRPRPPAA